MSRWTWPTLTCISVATLLLVMAFVLQGSGGGSRTTGSASSSFAVTVIVPTTVVQFPTITLTPTRTPTPKRAPTDTPLPTYIAGTGTPEPGIYQVPRWTPTPPIEQTSVLEFPPCSTVTPQPYMDQKCEVFG